MKRFHVHVGVKNLQESIRFYSTMFGTAPTVAKPDYAKWMLDDPRVNFAISERGQAIGINHLGVQAETDEELEGIHARLVEADRGVVAEEGVACCYAESDKYWVTDPQGIAWESFRSLGSVPFFGGHEEVAATSCGTPSTEAIAEAGCCAPATTSAKEAPAMAAAAGCCAPATVTPAKIKITAKAGTGCCS